MPKFPFISHWDLFCNRRKISLNHRYTGQTGRYTGLIGRYTGMNRLNGEIWIPPVPTGFRPNRTGIPVPEPGGLAGPVGN